VDQEGISDRDDDGFVPSPSWALGVARCRISQEANSGYPMVLERAMQYGSLAASHLNMTLRCFEQNMVSPITGRHFTIGGEASQLCA